MTLTLERYTPAVSVRTQAPFLPEELLKESPSTKTLYLYLAPLGAFEASVTDLERCLGMARRSAHGALRRLIKLGLLEVVREPSGSAPGRYRVRQP